jgi:hypothetical protein
MFTRADAEKLGTVHAVQRQSSPSTAGHRARRRDPFYRRTEKLLTFGVNGQDL